MEFENLKLKCECGGKMNKIKTDWHGIEVSTIPQPIMEAENLKEGQKMKWRIEDSRLNHLKPVFATFLQRTKHQL